MFFKKFCIATRTRKVLKLAGFRTFSNLLAVIRKRKITLSNTFLTHSGKRLFLGTKSNHNRESNAPKIKMISGAVLRSDDGGIWP